MDLRFVHDDYFAKCIVTVSYVKATVHSVTDRQMDGQMVRRQDYANSQSYRVAV